MRTAFLLSLAFATPIFAFAGCSSSTPVAPLDDGGTDEDAAPDAGADVSDAAPCAVLPCTTTNIRHIVIVIQENKTFDVNLGGYCTAAAGSNPTCTSGPS